MLSVQLVRCHNKYIFEYDYGCTWNILLAFQSLCISQYFVAFHLLPFPILAFCPIPFSTAKTLIILLDLVVTLYHSIWLCDLFATFWLIKYTHFVIFFITWIKEVCIPCILLHFTVTGTLIHMVNVKVIIIYPQNSSIMKPCILP